MSFSKSTGAGCVVCPRASVPGIRQSKATAAIKLICLTVYMKILRRSENAPLSEIADGMCFNKSRNYLNL
jgi:hypothetical protein